jgi:elongation factor G
MATLAYHIGDIRNIALAGHGASAKTSLVDALLFAAGATDRRGSVDDGTSLSDVDDEERRRHITIDCHLLHLEWKGKQVHLIDSPGYPDFIGNALSALAAVENVLVTVSAPTGIEVNTRRMFQEAGRLGLGRFLALTKMDADNVDYRADLEGLRASFGPQCVPFNVPDAVGPGFSRVLDVLSPPADVPAGAPLPPAEATTMVVEQIVETDEGLMARYLEGEVIPPAELRRAACKAVAAGSTGRSSASRPARDVGLRDFAGLLAECALCPVDVPPQGLAQGQRRGSRSRRPGRRADRPGLQDGHRHRSWASSATCTSSRATFSSDTTLVNLRTGQDRDGPATLYPAPGQGAGGGPARRSPATSWRCPSSTTCTSSDTCSHVGGHRHAPHVVLQPIKFPTPMVPRAVEPKTREDEPKISVGLAKIADEDPTFTYRRDPQTHELVISGMSELHLDVIQNRLKSRYKLDVNTHIPHVPYLETITGSAEADHRHKKQTGGRGQFGEVHLRVRPRERGQGFSFVDAVKGGVIPNQYIPAVEKGVREQLEKGIISGNPVVDVEVEVYFGKDHPVDSSEQAFKTAAATAFRKAFEKARPVLLEPIVTLEITVPSAKFGDISADLSTRRGTSPAWTASPATCRSSRRPPR